MNLICFSEYFHAQEKVCLVKLFILVTGVTKLGVLLELCTVGVCSYIAYNWN